MERVLKSGRIDYAKRSPYNRGVYIGNWFEDRCKYVKQKHQHISIYMQDYIPKPYSKLDGSILSDRKFQGDGCGARLLFDHDGNRYMKNMSSLKDLSYNHVPKWSGDVPVHRHWRFRMERWEPEQDYCKNFGNLTDYGISQCKKKIWSNSSIDPKCPSKTDYQDTFQPPLKENYRFTRWTIPRPNSSIMNKLNFETVHLRYRNKEINNVTPSGTLVLVPREERCNPITWKCPNDISTVVHRCVTEKIPDSSV